MWEDQVLVYIVWDEQRLASRVSSLGELICAYWLRSLYYCFVFGREIRDAVSNLLLILEGSSTYFFIKVCVLFLW